MWEAALWLLGTVFAAGVSWTTVRLTQRQTQRQLDGVARIGRDVRDKNDSRYMALCLALMIFVPEKDRAAVAAMLKPGMEK
jgi:hypothetical protein